MRSLSRAPSMASPRWRRRRVRLLRPFEFQASRQTRTITASVTAGGAAAAARPSFSLFHGPAMDSLPGEDPTLPLEFNSSVNISRLPDVSGDEIRTCLGGGGGLPDVAEDTVSPTRARTMKDFENQIIELRKENFNLKLRIYFLEERMQQKFDGPNEDIYRINIELKVELESQKRELQERERLLVKASKAVESLAQGGDAEIQHLKEEAHKKVQQVEESLTHRITLLEEDLKTAQEEVEKAFAMTEHERVLRLTAEQQLSLITNMQPKDLDVMTVLEEKDRCIEQLNLSLKNKEALIQSLEEAESQKRSLEESLSGEKIQDHTIALVCETEKELEALRTEFSNEKRDFEKRIESFQEELREREMQLSVEKRNALKRDKTIQGLTLALKAKENENEELSSEIEDLKTSLAKAREAIHKAQMQKFKGVEDSQTLLMEKEGLLADLRSENLTKDTENRKLQRKIKRTEQELNDLHLEREKLVKELEEIQLQKSRSDKTINDLRNQLEKSHDEMVDKEKALELHYSVLLSEGNQKLQRQELAISHLTASVAQKDEVLQKLNEVIKEKDVEFQKLFAKFQSLLKDKEDLKKWNENLVKEKCAAWSQQPVIQLIPESEKTKESEYAGIIEGLQKERDVFSALIKSLQDADGITNLQEELHNISLLRKQLEDDILANWNLQKVLEDQIKANQREEETISSCGDRTSYMSIRLREPDCLELQLDQLSLEELKRKVVELLSVVKELHLANQDLKRKQLEFCTSDTLAKGSQETLDQSEFLERTEECRTPTGAFDDETNTSNSLFTETLSEVSPSDYLDRQSLKLNKPGFEHELAVGKCFGGSAAGKKGDAQERRSLMSLLNDNGVAVLESRQEQRKISNNLLDHPNTPEQDSSIDDLEKKDETDLKQLVVQLRVELQQLRQVKKFQKPQVKSESALAEEEEEEEGLDLRPVLQINAAIGSPKVEVKDAATQTATAEGHIMGLKHEGKIAASEDKAASLRLNEECGQKHQQETLPCTRKMNKSDPCYPFKKSRLPILLKSSKSLESISLSAPLQKADIHLQHRIFTLDEDLKEGYTQPQRLDELQLSRAENERSVHDGIYIGAESLIKLDGSKVDVSLISGESKGETAKDQSNSQEMETNTPEQNLPATKGLNQELAFLEKEDGDATTTYSGCKSLYSLSWRITSTDEFDCEAIDDIEELRQRIKDLKSELAKYRMLMIPFESAKQVPPGDILSVIQNDRELPADHPFLPELKASRTFFGAQSPTEPQIHIKALTSHALEQQNEEKIQKLKELLSENEAELEKEQIANIHLLDEVCHLQNKLKGISQARHVSLIHLPAHEQSCQRQKIQECHSICATYRQHLSNLIRAFEELLQASEVDYYVAEGFRERLNQSAQLFERLEQQCLYGESIDDEMARLCGLVRRLSNFEMSQKPSSSESSGPKKEEMESERDNPAVVPNKFPPELSMEHLQEIRTLRHQLEESIRTNDRLRKQLQQVSDSAQDQEKQKENEKMCESLSKKHLAAEHLHEYEHLKKEKEKLQKQLGKREEENRDLMHNVYNVSNKLNRLQIELNAKQHQLSENDKLLHSLRLELKVYEKLDKAIRSQKDCSHGRVDECGKDQNHLLDLHELLTEIQNLRVQLERSIKANKMLHMKVEEQLSRGMRERSSSGSTTNIGCLFKQELPNYAGINELQFPTANSNVLELQLKNGNCIVPLKADTELTLENSDSSSHCSSSASQSSDPCVVPSHCVWADKNGQHILGFIEDYNSLQKQILDGQKRLSELELPLKETELQGLGVTVPQQASLNRLSATLCAIQHSLEEAARLLKLLWRVSLPMKVVHSAAYAFQDEDMKAELNKLHRKLAEQEKRLHSTIKRLHATNQLKENMERVIIDQLALTHDVLKKARGNLEVQPAENKPSASSLSNKRVL
ncbi:CDK5 regulatory subunit-associated protein 2 isoform X2 [Rhineura floridana]|uniref:CDK5 regulatory subunit-associated protein 2 isoform X2 n=1 Tax=Rhineura floridana TaxID=261503 RepID=UPI002AC7F79B|nr:CDK5 regulatory subunit-associated protein 2 isoform X2 [Rhineura floridana]